MTWREETIGEGYGWECKKCGAYFEDEFITLGYYYGLKHVNKIREGEFGEDLKNALALIPDDKIWVFRDSYKCPHCNNLRVDTHISTSRPSFNEYVVKKYEHHICDRCSHEMRELTNMERNHRLICPKCGAKMKITTYMQT